MSTNDKKEFVLRVGFQVNAAAQTQVNAAQQQPVQTTTTTDVAAPAGAPIP
jgi:hypothetical protein